MSIYTHFRHFLLPNTHIFHIFSTSNLNNLLDILVLKYAHGLEKPKNDDKKAKYQWYDLHIAFALIFSLILRLATLILGIWGWQVWYYMPMVISVDVQGKFINLNLWNHQASRNKEDELTCISPGWVYS